MTTTTTSRRWALTACIAACALTLTAAAVLAFGAASDAAVPSPASAGPAVDRHHAVVVPPWTADQGCPGYAQACAVLRLRPGHWRLSTDAQPGRYPPYLREWPASKPGGRQCSWPHNYGGVLWAGGDTCPAGRVILSLHGADGGTVWLERLPKAQ